MTASEQRKAEIDRIDAAFAHTLERLRDLANSIEHGPYAMSSIIVRNDRNKANA